MMIKDDGDGVGGEEAKTEEDTMPCWVLLAITNEQA